jgi:hypothetical protein
MKQAVVNELATKQYYPYYKEHRSNPSIKQAVAAIVTEERAKHDDPLILSRGVRTRINELLQSRIPVVDPQMIPTSNARQMREQVENHHNHQTAHFQAIWQVTDELAKEAGVELDGDRS